MTVEAGTRLSDSQRRAVEMPEKSVVVTAAAGSGKTRVLVERFLHLVRSRSIPASRIVVITYTEKAANELKRRLRSALGADFPDNGNVTTIHGYCRKLLLENPIEAGIDPAFSVIDEDLADLLKRETVEDVLESAYARPEFRTLFDAFAPSVLDKSLIAVQDKWRSSGREPRPEPGDPGEAHAAAFVRLLKDFDAEYARRKKERAAADFDDLIHIALKLLESPDWRARAALDVDAVMVDEYQDVNALQARIIGCLAEGRELFIVGDARQSIYGFRHAECRYLVERAEAARSAGCLVELQDNHRSLPGLVAFVNAVFDGEEAAPGFGFGRMFAARGEEGEAPAWPAGGRRVELYVERGSEGLVDERRRREARRIAARIRELAAEGRKYGDIAVLFPKLTGVELYEAEFKRAGVRYHLIRGRGFYDQMEVADVVRALRAVLDPSDELALMSCAKSPMGGLSDDALYLVRKSFDGTFYEGLKAGAAGTELDPRDAEKCRKFLAWFDDLRGKRHLLSAGQMIERLLEATDYDCRVLSRSDGERRWLNLVKLKEKAELFGRFSQGDLDRFTRFLQDITDRQVREAEASVETESGNAVKILTVHSAKGLEFPVVFVAGTGDDRRGGSEGAFVVNESFGVLAAVPQPGGKVLKGERHAAAIEARKLSELGESRRLLYVALTRATELLVLCGTVQEKVRSTWIDWVAAAVPQIREEGASGVVNAAGVPVLLELVETAESAPAAPAPPLPPVPAAGPERALAVLERLKPFRLDYPETVNFTVSHLVEFRQDPAAAGLSRPEPDWEEDGIIGAAEYGNLTHYVMQHLDFTKPAEEEVRKLLRAWTRPVDEAVTASVVRAAHAFSVSPAGAEVRAAAMARGSVYRELPFLFRITEGETDLGFLIGQADLLYRSDEGWTVVDYKTGAARPDDHAFQVRAYAHCLQALLDEPVRRSILYYTETGESVDAGPAPDAQEFGRELVRLFGGMRAKISLA